MSVYDKGFNWTKFFINGFGTFKLGQFRALFVYLFYYIIIIAIFIVPRQRRLEHNTISLRNWLLIAKFEIFYSLFDNICRRISLLDHHFLNRFSRQRLSEVFCIFGFSLFNRNRRVLLKQVIFLLEFILNKFKVFLNALFLRLTGIYGLFFRIFFLGFLTMRLRRPIWNFFLLYLIFLMNCFFLLNNSFFDILFENRKLIVLMNNWFSGRLKFFLFGLFFNNNRTQLSSRRI